MINVKFNTGEGAGRAVNMRRSDKVGETLGSVSEMCDKGDTLNFTSKGGSVLRDPDQAIARQAVMSATSRTDFRRQRGTYVLDMWVDLKAAGAAGGAGVPEPPKPTGQARPARAARWGQGYGRQAKAKTCGQGHENCGGHEMEVDVVAAEEYEAFMEQVTRSRRKGSAPAATHVTLQGE